MILTMRSFGRLIVRGKYLTNPIYTNCTRTISTRRRIKESYVFPTILNSYNDFNLSGYTDCKHYHTEAETDGGSDFKYKRSIRKGDTISLNDLLFTSNRDYLIKKNNQYVKADHLNDKVIGIYFLPLTNKDPEHSMWHTVLKDVYDDLYPAKNFEIVLVACNDPDTNFREEMPVHCSPQCDSQKLFEDLISYMPWTAIPFADVASRKHIQRSFGLSEEYTFPPTMYIVDQTGMVLQCSSWDIFDNYGALGYPFSDKRLKFLRTEDYLASQQPSLKTLLGSSQRDYVISNNGEKVPIHTFENKVVALYFYQPDSPDSDLLTEKLKLAYEEFTKKKKIFEVVLVYIREPCGLRYGSKKPLLSEKSFWEVFKTMPWLALPFKDMSYKKLKRVIEFKSYDVNRLVIFGPHANYIEPFGSSMMLRYGTRAFPFTCKNAVELEIEKVKELNLGMLWNPNTVFRRNDGSQVPFSLLSGKRVVLVLEGFNPLERIEFSNGRINKFFAKLQDSLQTKGIEWISLFSEEITKPLTMLKEKYLQSKGTDDEFEVIRILTNNIESPIYNDFVGGLPWLVSPASELIHDLGSSPFWISINSSMDANKPGSTRQSKRLKQLQLPKTSFNSPLDLDSDNSHEDEKVQEQQILEPTVMANTTESDDDDDFVNTIPQTKSNRVKKGDTGVRTAAGLQSESRSKKTADVPHLTPENIQATVQKTKRYKERAKKTIRIEEDRIRRKEMAKKRKINFQDVEEGMVKKKQINKTTKSKLGLVDEPTDEDEPKEPIEKAMNKKEMKKKRKTSEKEEHGSEDNDEPNETIRKKKNVTKLFKIRNSPSNLTTMMSVLSGQQRTWVRTTGFGSLFDFNLERIPHHLAFHILQSFDASSRSLQIAGKTLPITDIDVHEVLGLPIGQKSFTYAKTTARKNLWTSQFPGKPQYNISPSTVVDIISASDEDDEIFKINFLIVLFNILIERNTSSYLLRDVLDYNIDLDNCCEYNWGELLLNSLVKTKNTWPTLSSLFYPGPIIFLTIFYVDRVIIKGTPEVERQFPAFKGWTVQMLKQRQADEFKDDSFGKREIIRARWQIQNAKGNDAMTGKAPGSRQSQENEGNDAMVGNTHASCQPQANEDMYENVGFTSAGENEQTPKDQTRENENDGPTCVSPSGQYEPTQKDWFDRLSIKAVMLMDAIELYNLELEAAKSLHPNNVEISDIEGKVIAEIQKLKQSDSKPQPQSEVQSVGEIENKNEEPNVDVAFEEHEEINPDVLEELELMEYIYSSQGIRDMNEYMDELSRPSFSLGIDSILDVCNQINKEHGDIQSNEVDMVTPTPKECEKRTKRETKIGAAYRSPYVRRDINLGSKYSTQDYAVWRWLIHDGKDKYERAFQYGNIFCYRKHLATLSPSKKLYYCVVDVWSALMNEKETYKSAESPLRLFFDTGLSIGPLNKEKTEAEQYKIFVTGMNHFFEKYPNAKIKDYDLIFFPILASEHFYLVCLNLKAKTWDVIDNIRQGKAANNEYAFILRRLKKHFVKYLKEKDMTWFATSISRMETSYLTMPWQTLQNVTDCGVFLMRHMETYKGDAKNWETQLKAEKKGNLQKGQLDKLRIKYAHAILTSHVNEKREFVIKESNLFYNKLAGEGLLKLVMESSQKKHPRKRNIEGTRLFEDE